MESLFSAIIVWVCGLIMWALAFWAYKRTTPMHFWAGTTVKPEEISDIPAYNRENALMWFIYGAFSFVSGIVMLFSVAIGAILVFVLSVFGIIPLIWNYKRIYKKYKV